MEEAVNRDWAVFSETAARRRGLPWLDLVRDQALIDKLAGLAGLFEREGYRPAALTGLVSGEEARKRWAALRAFHATHQHLLISNGPYKLKAWTERSATLEAFRDLTYPLGVGSWDAYANPRRAFITGTAWQGGRLSLAADLELIEKFQRSFRLLRTPMLAITAADLKRAKPECHYIVTDSAARVVLAGRVEPGAKAAFEIDLNDRLPAGHYVIAVQISVNDNLMHADVTRLPFSVPFSNGLGSPR
jgi:hypothetical protein